MPTHWESSKRPLFVRTVFVNGSRHAILSQEDPLCQSNVAPSSRKQSRPSSCQSFVSSYSINSLGSQESNLGKRLRNSKNDSNYEQGQHSNKGDVSTELQGCLVKLRLVLATHENKNKIKNEHLVNGKENEKKSSRNVRPKENYKQKRKKSNHPKTNKKKNCDYYCYFNEEEKGEIVENVISGYEEENNNYYGFNNNMTNKDLDYYFMDNTSHQLLSSSFNCCCEKDANLIEIRDICCFEGYHDHKTENEFILSQTYDHLSPLSQRMEKNSSNRFFPTIHIPGNDISWNSISSDSYFTRSFYNPLSERVLQWLDLANKRRESITKADKVNEDVPLDHIERIFEGRTFLDENNISKYREKAKSKRSKMSRSRSEGKASRITTKETKREIFKQKDRRSFAEKDAEEEEVKQENDVETALSNEVIAKEYPKFAKELNKIHTSKSLEKKSSTENEDKLEKRANSVEIVPEKVETESSSSSVIIIPKKIMKESEISLNLQESIMNSFNEVVTLKPNGDESNHKPKNLQTASERRSLLLRQSKFQESSDEDDDNSSIKTQRIEYWCNKTPKQKRNAFCSKNNVVNKTIDCHNGRYRKDGLKRQKNPPFRLKEKNNDNQTSIESQNIIQAIFQQNPLPPHLQNKIPWLRDYQTGGKNMWPSDKGTSKPQLHIFMPAIPPKINESGTGETGDESISDCESFSSEVYL